MNADDYSIHPIGVIRSPLISRKNGPRQGYDNAPEAWVELSAEATPGLKGIAVGDDVIVVTWLHHAHRDVLQVHPRRRTEAPLTGVFATRSPDRPNPIGLHRVTVLEIEGSKLRIAAMDAIDGTPVVDIKTVLAKSDDR